MKGKCIIRCIYKAVANSQQALSFNVMGGITITLKKNVLQNDTKEETIF